MFPSLLRYLLLLLAFLTGVQPCPVFSAPDPGQSAVLHLRQRFNDIRPECPDGSAAHNCNGVLIRHVRETSNPTFWNVSEKDIARQGVSFFYLRADVGTVILGGAVGLIMRELGAPAAQPLTIRCVFPSDAGTDNRVNSCASHQVALPCPAIGVVDIPTWRAHYLKYGRREACYFEPTARWFQFNIEVREHFPEPAERRLWNEVIIAPWPQDVPGQLPLEALYYQDAPGSDHLQQARLMQENFIRATGQFIPIVRVEPNRPPVFFYEPKDQSRQPSTPTKTSDGEIATQMH